MISIGIGALALVVVLSAFNGLQDLVHDLYSAFDPDIKITVKEGKTFNVKDFPKNKIVSLEEIQYYSRCLEETALLKYNEKQSVATVKGVEPDFLKMSGLDTLMVEGRLMLENHGIPMAVVGYGIGYNLSLYIDNNYRTIKIYAPKRTKTVTFNPEQAFNKKNIVPAGIFTINPDFDDKYVLVPLSFAEELMEFENEATSVEIGLVPGTDEIAVKQKIQELVGDQFDVKTRFELNEIIFKTNNTEKWVTFLILSFILIIATFNVIGSLTMLIIDKKDDINILKSLGAGKSAIRSIFLLEGLLITLVGGVSGMLLGALLCKGQQTFGFIKLSGIVVDYYPVLMKPLDFLLILATVLFIGFVSSWFPVRYVVRKYV